MSEKEDEPSDTTKAVIILIIFVFILPFLIGVLWILFGLWLWMVESLLKGVGIIGSDVNLWWWR